jgi:hypothetical protein
MVKAGIETFVVVTEPDGAGSLIDSCDRIGANIDKLHWRESLPGSAGWSQVEDMVSKINSMNQQQLADQKDMGKSGFRDPAMRFLQSFQNFQCDRTGDYYGSPTSWDATRCLAVDSLTGWCLIAWGATVGYKPTANPGEWGIAQNFVFNMLTKINCDRQCYFVLTAHMEKEMDELQGIKKLMVSAIGAKLAPKIPPFFSEVVKCERLQGNIYNWSTYDTGMDLKARALPNSNKITPDFQQIVDAYQRRLRLAGAASTPAPAAAGTHSAGTSSPPPSAASVSVPPSPLGRDSVKQS